MKLIESYLDYLHEEEKWSGEIKTKWHPKEGFFAQSADRIAGGLKSASKSYKQAMSRLNFFINRAGSNLDPKDRKKLETAKNRLASLYGEEIGEMDLKQAAGTAKKAYKFAKPIMTSASRG